MKKILVVEDDIDIHNLLKNILEEERYKVISAYSGTEAVLLIEKNDIDLILLDLMLPGLIGEEIVKKVTNIPICRPIEINKNVFHHLRSCYPDAPYSN